MRVRVRPGNRSRMHKPSFFLLAMTLAASETGLSAAADLTAVVREIEETYTRIRDLQADFTQTTTVPELADPIRSAGRVALKRPGMFRWEYRDPHAQLLIIRSDEVWWYMPEQQQVIKTSASKLTDSQVPWKLLAGLPNLQSEFEVAWDGPIPAGTGAEPIRLTLRSKAAGNDPPYRIEVDPGRWMIRQVTLTEPEGAQSVFRFSKITVNQGVRDRLFVFTIPKDVEVIER
jgi:outer membrane lipoprotein carrier protein